MEEVGAQHFEGLVTRIERVAAQQKAGKGKGPRYTVILHDAKAQLELTVNEYVLADSIHKLSGNHSPIPGWCYASKEYLGSILGVSERSAFNLLGRLREKGIIEVHPQRSNLIRATKRWAETVEVLKDRAFSR